MTGSNRAGGGPLVDVHTHSLPQTLVKAFRARSEPPRIVDTADGSILDYGRGYSERIAKSAGNFDRLLDAMDRHGVTVSITSINQPGVMGIAAPEAASLARDANDELAEQVTKHRGRLAGLGTLPLQDPDAAMDELDHLMSIGLSGAMIVSNVNGVSIGAPEFDQIFQAAERLDAPLLLHPILPIAAEWFRRYELTVPVGFLYDTTMAATELVLGGVYDRYPRLKLVLGHAGSLLPQLVGRIDLEAERNPAVRGRLSVLPSEHIKLIYTDTVGGWPPAVRSALTLFGEDRVMFGSDFPFWDQGPSIDILAELAQAGESPPGIEARNAIDVFHLEPTSALNRKAASAHS